MPPPPLPDKLLQPTMPSFPAWRQQKPRSSSADSDKWVPSSQTQELSIPRYEFADQFSSGSVPSARSEGMPEVVPSSQSEEQELEPPDGLVHADHRPKPTPLQPSDPRTSTVISSENNEEGGMSSPEVIESSQSQFETEITAAMAEAMGARAAEIRRYV